MLRAMDGAWKIADVYIDSKQTGLGFAHIEKLFDEILNIEAEKIQELATKYLNINTLITIISGRY
jgi:hypothetical protein